MGSDLNKDIDKELKKAAGVVAEEARGRFHLVPTGGSAASAEGFKPRTKGFGKAVVQQSKRRRTGKRGDYGALQMRMALVPALEAKQGEVVRILDDMLERLGSRHGF